MNKLKINGKIIDLSVWKTQGRYAKDNKVKLGTVSQWVMRAKEGKKMPIEFITIDELGLTLVKAAKD